jgi:hypothetical protein
MSIRFTDITEQPRAMALRGVPQGYSVTFRYVP